MVAQVSPPQDHVTDAAHFLPIPPEDHDGDGTDDGTDGRRSRPRRAGQANSKGVDIRKRPELAPERSREGDYGPGPLQRQAQPKTRQQNNQRPTRVASI